MYIYEDLYSIVIRKHEYGAELPKSVNTGRPVNIHDVCIGVDGCKQYGQEQNMLHMPPLATSRGHVRDGSVLILRLNIAVLCIINPPLDFTRLLSGTLVQFLIRM